MTESATGNFDGSFPANIFVFMGVCGVGKSTLAHAAAAATDGVFLEADALHPQANVKAMSDGRPLTDQERWPWLEAVCGAALASAGDRPVMIACSALKRRYRDFMRARLPDPTFIHLRGSPQTIRARMADRQSHFMPPSLLESQIATLEATDGEPDCHTLKVDGALDAIAAQAIGICRRHIAATSQEAPSAPNESATTIEKHQRRNDRA